MMLTRLLVRTTRSRIIYLRNDYKALMNKIEVALHSYHAELANAPSTPPPIPQTATINPSDDQRDPVQLAIGQVDVDVPFAVIDVVSGGGPSEQSVCHWQSCDLASGIGSKC